MLVTARRLAPVLSLPLLASATACAGAPEHATALPSAPAQPRAADAAAPAATTEIDDATAVVRRYFDVVNRLPVAMDADALEALMADRCSCREQVRSVRRAVARGERYVDVTTNLALAPAVDSPTSVSVLAVYDATAGGLVDRDGRPLDWSPAQRRIKRLFRLTRHDGRWLIDAIEAA